jgi:hypothetical protein
MIGFAVASTAAALGVPIHTLIGSRSIVAPFLKAEGLGRRVRWLMFLCWHAVSVLLVVLAAGFAWAAWAGERARDLALMLSILAGLLALLTLYVSRRAGFNPLKLPPFVLFGLMAAAGAWGLLS